MRVLLPLLFLSCSACSAPPIPTTGLEEPRFHWASPELFDAFLPNGESFQFADGGTLAIGRHRSFTIALAPYGAQAGEFFEKCATDTTLDAVRWNGGLIWLRVDKYGNLQLDFGHAYTVEPFERPEHAVDPRGPMGASSSLAPPRLAADRDLLVLFAAPWIHHYEKGSW